MAKANASSEMFEPQKRRILVLRHVPNAGNHPPIYSAESLWAAADSIHKMMLTHGIAIIPPGYDFSVEEVDVLPPDMDKPTVIFNDKPRK